MDTTKRARHLVLQYGWNATAYQILNPGIHHWFSSSAPAVAGFVPRGNTWVVAGAPICPADALPAVTDELEHTARDQGRRVCYVAAAQRLESRFHDSPTHTRVTLGAQPVWNPHDWPAILKSRPSLRAQLSRARNKGVVVSEAVPDTLRNDPRLQHCLDDWLRARPMPPMHFLVEPATFQGELADRLLLTASLHDSPVAFLLASPVPQRRGYLVEQIIRAPHAPNGTAELLIHHLMTHLADRNCPYLTMGLVALSTHADPLLRENPLWLRLLMTWARAHGRRFYHFDGLENFRTKMRPAAWEPIYAITNQPHFTPASLYALLAAFSPGSLPAMIFQTLSRAVATEARTLHHSLIPTYR